MTQMNKYTIQLNKSHNMEIIHKIKQRNLLQFILGIKFGRKGIAMCHLSVSCNILLQDVLIMALEWQKQKCEPVLIHRTRQIILRFVGLLYKCHKTYHVSSDHPAIFESDWVILGLSRHTVGQYGHLNSHLSCDSTFYHLGHCSHHNWSIGYHLPLKMNVLSKLDSDLWVWKIEKSLPEGASPCCLLCVCS